MDFSDSRHWFAPIVISIVSSVLTAAITLTIITAINRDRIDTLQAGQREIKENISKIRDNFGLYEVLKFKSVEMGDDLKEMYARQNVIGADIQRIERKIIRIEDRIIRIEERLGLRSNSKDENREPQ